MFEFPDAAMQKALHEARTARLKDMWKAAQAAVEGYHVHIYFDKGGDDPESRRGETTAAALAADVKILFGGDVRGVYNVGVVGPHSRPNVEIDISRESFGRIVEWLQQNSQGLSILIHPETGDDLKDHLERSLWINSETPYRQAFFDRLRAGRPDAPVQKTTPGPA